MGTENLQDSASSDARLDHEARLAAEALRVSQEWFATVLRSIGDAVIATDAGGNVTFMNAVAEALTGWSSADAVKKPLAEVFVILSEATRQSVDSPVDRVIREGVIVGLANHTILVRRDGTELSIDDSAAPIRDSAGDLVGVVLVFRDVTDERAAALRQSFISRATVELNTSLDYQATLATVARLAVPAIADWCAVDVLEDENVEATGNAHGQAARPQQTLQRLAVAHIDPAKIAFVSEIERRYPPDPNAPSGVPNILRTGKSEMIVDIPPALIDAAARDDEHLALIRALDLHSYIGVPLITRGQTIGVISFVMAESRRRYTSEDLEVARLLADRAAAAIDNARLFRESQRAQREAELANRSKDEFLAILGHELRNPLAPILTALELMKLRAPDALTQERTVIERQVRHLVRLVDDLLDISRITRGKVELRREPSFLSDIVVKAIEMSSPLLEERQHELNVSVQPDLIVDGDAARLAQVIANLLNNAAKYTEKGGLITITADASDRWLDLRVKDSGIGISPEMLARIFDPFVQETQALDRAQGGLGLGLAIVRSLIAMHGGTVTAHSEGLKKGTEVIVRLPSSNARHSSSTPPSLPSPSKPLVRRTSRVLIVDDNADALDLMSEALGLLGYECHVAHDGPSALTLAADVRPTIAILDIGLPVMDGYELAQRFRAMPELSGIKLIAVTGYGQRSDRERGARAGFHEHLVKPIAIQGLESVLERLRSSK